MFGLASSLARFTWAIDPRAGFARMFFSGCGNSLRLQGDAIQRAKRYLEKLPPAIQGQNGSAACFRAACVLRRGFALNMEQSLQAIAEWNSRCEPPWSEWELRHKLEDAEKADGPRGHLLNAPKTRRR